jgi:hypothetical protein
VAVIGDPASASTRKIVCALDAETIASPQAITNIRGAR